MKYHFLLDENILHHAIRGVDSHERPDLTSARLVLLIAQNCHRIVLNEFLVSRYTKQLEKLKALKSPVLGPAFLAKALVHNESKFVMQFNAPPRLPKRCGVPAEDADVVRAALISHPIFVSAEDGLRRAVNDCEALHLRAISPEEALILAHET
ncbi:MAG: hypothetical protein ACLP1Y_17390 [Candidatus Acidiferrales bacterium]